MKHLPKLFIVLAAFTLAACVDQEERRAAFEMQTAENIDLMLPLCLQFHRRGGAPTEQQMAAAGFRPYSAVGNWVVSVGLTTIDYSDDQNRGMAFRDSCTMRIGGSPAINYYAEAIQETLIEQGYAATPSPRPRTLAVQKGSKTLTIGGFADQGSTTVWIGKI